MIELLLVSIIAFLTLALWVIFIYARTQLRIARKIKEAIDNQNNANSILVNKLCGCQIMADVWKVLAEIGVAPRQHGKILTPPAKKIIVAK